MDVHKESISMNGAGKIGMECVMETKASMILQFIDGLRGDSPLKKEPRPPMVRLPETARGPAIEHMAR
jgi:hypothetical protein